MYWKSIETEIKSLLEKLLDVKDAMSTPTIPTTSIIQKLTHHREILCELLNDAICRIDVLLELVIENHFSPNDGTLEATIGIDFMSKTMYLEDRTVRLQLW
ncbi:uncharacterized protein LOC131223852 [Magnolia sinica]|uniref:uncharacterized protein LOC131223852 n=1 Tax=Magnolia sinica TaxID=86752 RepID=UPI00265913F6|nr:uncharacterized protein LOC131223852 [Magnolia sinica]